MKRSTKAWMNGAAGVVIFSGSLPATRLAVEGFDPLFVTAARATIAGVLGGALLLFLGTARPRTADLWALGIVAIGVVLGFPLLTALALTHITSAHSVVFIGLLPLSTALFGAFRGGERPRPAFWVFSALGSSLVIGFAFSQGLNAAPVGDGLMLAAILICGLGYAEGARLSQRLGGWQVISWALVLSLPVMGTLMMLFWPGIDNASNAGPSAWAGLAYVSLFSMLIGFIFWYRGLALGGTASVGQLQLLQPFLGLLLAAVVLGEPVTSRMVWSTLGVILCVVAARKYGQPQGKTCEPSNPVTPSSAMAMPPR